VKPIRQLKTPTVGLQRFLETHAETESWEVFRHHAGGTAYRELMDMLEMTQRGLCAYCEIRLIPTDRQIEHFVPKEKHPTLTFDVGNLFAACRGGTNPHSREESRKSLKPSKRSCSCGQFKEQRVLDGTDPASPKILKPSEIPPFPRIFEVDRNGSIGANAQGSKAAGISVNQAEATLSSLNLNCERLKKARKVVWEELENDCKARLDDGADDEAWTAVLEECARVYLLPDADARLSEFFTTCRSFFGGIGDRLLGMNEIDWV
jgi:uncharacterized protein (TIGR02646 family)